MLSVKLLSLVALVACALVAARADPIERQACIAQSASYLARVQIEEPVRRLVSKSREFYPDVITLIEDEVPSNEYDQALAAMGNQLGCTQIVEHFNRLPQEVECYQGLDLEMDDMATLDIAKSGQPAKEVVEAYFACLAAIDD